MRDLARRVQALRKELGYVPTDILKVVNISELNSENVKLLEPYLEDMKELIRAENIHLLHDRAQLKAEWHESQLDDKKVYISIPSRTN
jgi:isoleucyl-tRNA synthetase